MRALPGLLLMVVTGAAAAQGYGPGPVLVRFETTAGAFTLALDAQRAPLSTANLVRYVSSGHYVGTVFHRVVADFVVQGGGHTVDGTEKPTGDPVPNESGNGLTNRRGTVAMARSGDPHSATSQFYVNLADNLNLDPRPDRWGYAVIGQVVQGMDVIERIAATPTGARGPFPQDTPLEPIVITRAGVVGAAQ
jgi:cyclophilin family peptidyl-prolyl cis-trans isomerase